jgi:hypothetical protein
VSTVLCMLAGAIIVVLVLTVIYVTMVHAVVRPIAFSRFLVLHPAVALAPAVLSVFVVLVTLGAITLVRAVS